MRRGYTATLGAVNALLKAMSFRNISDTPRTGTRNIEFKLSTTAGVELASATKLVRVSDGREPPVVT